MPLTVLERLAADYDDAETALEEARRTWLRARCEARSGHSIAVAEHVAGVWSGRCQCGQRRARVRVAVEGA